MVKPSAQNSLFARSLFDLVFDAPGNFCWLLVRDRGAKSLEVLMPQKSTFLLKVFQILLYFLFSNN